MRRLRRTTCPSRVIPHERKSLRKGYVWIKGKNGEPEQVLATSIPLEGHAAKRITAPTFATFEV